MKSDATGLRNVDVVILAGGLGTRLRSVVGEIPKPIVPINGRPFLAYVCDQVRRQGARRIVLSIGHKAETIQACVKGWKDVTCVVEPEPLGTGGAVRFALKEIRTDPVLVMNGDTYVDAPFEKFLEFHRVQNSDGSLIAAKVADASRFGTLDIDRRGRVTAFLEKGRKGPGWVNAGVYLLARKVIERIPEGRKVSLETDVLPKEDLFAWTGDYKFLDIGTPESLASASKVLEELSK